MVLSPGCQTYLLNYWFLTSCYFSDGQPLNSVNAWAEQQKSFLEGKGQDIYSDIKGVNFKSHLKDINFIYSLIHVGKIKIAGSFTMVLWKINYLLLEGGKKNSQGVNYTYQTSDISFILFAEEVWGLIPLPIHREGKKLFDKIIIFASCCTGGTEVWDLAKGSIRLTIWYPPPHQTTTCSLMPSAERRREGTGSH